jgi:hypothetical protein
MEKRIYFPALILCLLFLKSYCLQAETKESEQWSISVYGDLNTNFGVSSDMDGNLDDAMKEFFKYGDISKFPFNDDDLSSFMIGAELAYRFKESPLGLYTTYKWTHFDKNRTTYYKASAFYFTYSLGGSYELGELSDLCNLFAKAGLTISYIGGRYEIPFFGSNGILRLGYRGGFETEVGGRINIPKLPISIEAAVNYANLNLIGKKSSKSFSDGDDINIYDGPNSEYKHIGGKTFDILSLKLGLRLWL